MLILYFFILIWKKYIYISFINSDMIVIFFLKLVKAGLILGLFGGSQKFLNDKVHVAQEYLHHSI